MNVLLGLAVFVGLALVGWGLAELKAKVFTYHRDDEEEKAEKQATGQPVPEMGIKDVIENISAKGFKSN